MKKLTMLFAAMLVGMTSFAASMTLYLDATMWNNAGAADIAVYHWGGTSDADFVTPTLVDGETNIYQFSVADDVTNLIFLRMNPEGTGSSNWDKEWNRATTTAPTGSNNLFTVTQWGTGEGNGSGTWSVYTPASSTDDEIPEGITSWRIVAQKEICAGSNDYDVTTFLNNMILDSETGIYTLELSNLTLEAQSYNYYVAANKSSENAVWRYPSASYKTITPAAAGTYTIVYSWNPDTKTLSATLDGAIVDEPIVDAVISVVGTCTNSDNWDKDAAVNVMTLNEEGKYVLVVEDVTLEANVSYQYKIIQDHSWSSELYPNAEDNGNATFTVEETAVYTVTYTYDVEADECVVVATKAGDAGEITHIYSIMGELVSWGWDEGSEDIEDMELQEDGTYKYVVESFEANAQTYQYKLIADHTWGVYELPMIGNLDYTFETAGEYKLEFVADLTTHTLTLTATLVGDVVEPDPGTAVISVVGTCTNSENWDKDAAVNVMTLNEEGKYVLVVEDVTLEANVSYQYKIIQDHSWSSELYPNAEDNGNATFTVEETAVYTVTYTYDVEADECVVVATKAGESGEITHVYSIMGDFVSWEWEPESAEEMTEISEGVYQYVVENFEAAENGSYAFKLIADHAWGVYELPMEGNYYYYFEEGGIYDITFTFTLAQNTLEANAVKQETASKLENTLSATLVYSLGQTIRAQFNGTQEVEVYSITGNLVDATTVADEYSRTMNSGLYIVRIAGETFKVVVR